MLGDRLGGRILLLKRKAILHVGFGVLLLTSVVMLVLISIVDPALFTSIIEAIERIIDVLTP